MFILEQDIRKFRLLLASQQDQLRTHVLNGVQIGLFGIRGAQSELISPAQVDEMLEKYHQVEKVRLEIDNIETQIKIYGATVTATNPKLAEMNKQLAEANEKLRNLKSKLHPQATDKIHGLAYRTARSQVEGSEKRLGLLKDQYEEVKNKVEDLQETAGKIGKQSFEFENRKADVAEAEIMLKKLRERKEQLDIENYAKKRDIEPRAAEVSLNQASLIKAGAGYSLAGLLLGLFGVSYLEARVRRVHKSVDVQQELGIDTLGVLPVLSGKEGKTYGRVLAANQSLTGIMFTEAVNSLCATLLCDDRLGRGAAIMVTSASEHEGKTLLAAEMAAGLARTGRRTLLLDCDFRNSRCHEHVGLEAGAGLSEVLRGEVELADVLRSVPESEAKILTAGQCCAQVVKALSNGEFAALLTRLRQEFDCIIIDSAPTLVVAEGLLIGKLVDGVILVVRPKVSKARAVHSAFEQLTTLKIRILGAVVNANPARSSSSYYRT
jgi:capsular exopolysaccharide synthesis family protein